MNDDGDDDKDYDSRAMMVIVPAARSVGDTLVQRTRSCRATIKWASCFHPHHRQMVIVFDGDALLMLWVSLAE